MTNVNRDNDYMDLSESIVLKSKSILLNKTIDYSKLSKSNEYYIPRKVTFEDYRVHHPYFYDPSSSLLNNDEKIILSKLVEEEFGIFDKSWEFLLRNSDDDIEFEPMFKQAKYILNYNTDKHSLKALLFVFNSVVENFLSVRIVDDLFKNFSRNFTKEKNPFVNISPSYEYYFEKDDVASENNFINHHRFYNWLSNKNMLTTFGESLKNDYLNSNKDTNFHCVDPEFVYDSYCYFIDKPYFDIENPRNNYIDDDEEIEIIKRMIRGIEKTTALEFLVFSEIVNIDDWQSKEMNNDELHTLQKFKENWGSFLSDLDVDLFKKEFSQDMPTISYKQHFYLFIFALLENNVDKTREIYDYVYSVDDTMQYYLVSDEKFYNNIREWNNYNIPWSLYKNVIEN